MVQLWGIDQAKRCAEGSVRRAVLAEITSVIAQPGGESGQKRRDVGVSLLPREKTQPKRLQLKRCDDKGDSPRVPGICPPCSRRGVQVRRSLHQSLRQPYSLEDGACRFAERTCLALQPKADAQWGPRAPPRILTLRRLNKQHGGDLGSSAVATGVDALSPIRDPPDAEAEQRHLRTVRESARSFVS